MITSGGMEYARATLREYQVANSLRVGRCDIKVDLEQLERRRFCLYGSGFKTITLSELIERQNKYCNLIARVEHSGCESVYVEVAAVDFEQGKIRRLCFLKAENFVHQDLGIEDEVAGCERIVKMINQGSLEESGHFPPLINRLQT